MRIGGYLPTSVIEWPGKIVAVVWVIGCNFRCPFCYNTNLVVGPFPKAIAEGKILADLKRRRVWLDGVVVTGGEPTLQPDLVGFCRRIKELGLEVGVETNGSQPKVIKRLIGQKLVDFWAIDYKVCFGDYHLVAGGKTKGVGKRVRESLCLLLRSGLPLEVRTTIVPSLHPKDYLLTMAEELAQLVGCYRPGGKNFAWRWQNFEPTNTLNPAFGKQKPYPATTLAQLAKRTKFGNIRI